MQSYTGQGQTEGRSESAADQAKQKASEVAGQAQHKAEQLAGQAKEQAASKLDEQKSRATSELGSISSALHSTSESLREQDQGAIANYVDDAARQVERLSGYLDSHSVNELFNEAERFARREPALFLGGALLLGLVGARFFKSHSPGRDYDAYAGGRGRSYGGGRAYQGRPRVRSYGERYYDEDRRFEDSRYLDDRYDQRYYVEDESARSRQTSRTGRPEYDRVHGTAGAEMPDPDRQGARSSSTDSRTNDLKTNSPLGSGSTEGGRQS